MYVEIHLPGLECPSFSKSSSVSCQLTDIGSHSQLSNEQKRCISKQTRSRLVHIQTKTFECVKSFTRKALAIREKLCPSPSLLINIKSCYKRNRLIGWLFRWLFNSPQENLPIEKCYTDEQDCHPIYNHVINKTPPNVNRFADFCHHHLVTTTAHTHVYRSPLFNSGMKTGL